MADLTLTLEDNPVERAPQGFGYGTTGERDAITGDALVEGIFFFSTTDNTLYRYDGAAWVSYLSDAAPASLGAASAGVSAAPSRADHVHAHGNQLGGSLHAVASGAAAGFMSAADKTKLDGLSPGGGSFEETYEEEATTPDNTPVTVEIAGPLVAGTAYLFEFDALVTKDPNAGATEADVAVRQLRYTIALSDAGVASSEQSIARLAAFSGPWGDLSGASMTVAFNAGTLMVELTISSGTLSPTNWKLTGRLVASRAKA